MNEHWCDKGECECAPGSSWPDAFVSSARLSNKQRAACQLCPLCCFFSSCSLTIFSIPSPGALLPLDRKYERKQKQCRSQASARVAICSPFEWKRENV